MILYIDHLHVFPVVVDTVDQLDRSLGISCPAALCKRLGLLLKALILIAFEQLGFHPLYLIGARSLDTERLLRLLS